jgi:hypothetical protein
VALRRQFVHRFDVREVAVENAKFGELVDRDLMARVVSLPLITLSPVSALSNRGVFNERTGLSSYQYALILDSNP